MVRYCTRERVKVGWNLTPTLARADATPSSSPPITAISPAGRRTLPGVLGKGVRCVYGGVWVRATLGGMGVCFMSRHAPGGGVAEAGEDVGKEVPEGQGGVVGDEVGLPRHVRRLAQLHMHAHGRFVCGYMVARIKSGPRDVRGSLLPLSYNPPPSN